MAIKAQILSPWGVDPNDGSNSALVVLAYPPPQGASFTDVTGTPGQNIPPNPNLVVVQLDGSNDAHLAQIVADARFTVLWNE